MRVIPFKEIVDKSYEQLMAMDPEEIQKRVREMYLYPVCQGPGHETPADQPFIQVYVDPDGQKFVPKPPNERTIGISSEPDRDTGSEVEV